jgi:uncharacterized SAM-binding protein YcdF (DUF218 family)
MRNKVKIGNIAVGLTIGGIAYWFQAYNQLTIFGLHILLIMGVGTFIGSVLLMLYLKERPLKIAMLFSLGVALAVLARIIYDITFLDSTSHNLAPFEIIISGFITIPSAIAGVYFGLLIKKVFALNKN